MTGGTFGFYLRVGDGRGEPRTLDEDPAAIEKVESKPAPGEKSTKGPRSVLAQLEERAAGEKASAESLENLARLLWYTGADDPAEHRARQLAQRAAELSPSVARHVLASMLSAERYEKMFHAQKAVALGPKDPSALLLHAELIASGPAGERALSLFEAVPRQGTYGLDALEQHVGQLSRLGLASTAIASARTGLAQAPRSSAWMARLADLVSSEARRDELIQLEQTILKQRFDHVAARRILLEDALAQRRDVEILEHLEALRALFPGEEKRSLYIADAYDALGRDDLVAGHAEGGPRGHTRERRPARALRTSAAARRAERRCRRELSRGAHAATARCGDPRAARAGGARAAPRRELRRRARRAARRAASRRPNTPSPSCKT